MVPCRAIRDARFLRASTRHVTYIKTCALTQPQKTDGWEKLDGGNGGRPGPSYDRCLGPSLYVILTKRAAVLLDSWLGFVRVERVGVVIGDRCVC